MITIWKGILNGSMNLYRSQGLPRPMTVAAAQSGGSGGTPILVIIILSAIVIVAGVALSVFLLTRMLNNRFIREQQLDAENIILVAKQRAQQIETKRWIRR